MFNVQESLYYNESRPAGLLYMVHDPYEWPNIARFIPVGSASGVRIFATSYYISNDVKSLSVSYRKCIYQSTTKYSGALYLDNMQYLRTNCISACRQLHMSKFCNCSMDFLFPDKMGKRKSVKRHFGRSQSYVSILQENTDHVQQPILPVCTM